PAGRARRSRHGARLDSRKRAPRRDSGRRPGDAALRARAVPCGAPMRRGRSWKGIANASAPGAIDLPGSRHARIRSHGARVRVARSGTPRGARGQGAPLRLSVVMAVVNGGKDLQRTLDSIFTQTERDFELIVVDDGSTDDTSSILAKQ